MGDEDERPAVAEEEVFQPADRLDVEVVGRLVEQEDVGLVDEGPGQQDPPLHPRGEGLEPGVGVEPHPGEDRPRPGGRCRRAAWSVVVEALRPPRRRPCRPGPRGPPAAAGRSAGLAGG